MQLWTMTHTFHYARSRLEKRVQRFWFDEKLKKGWSLLVERRPLSSLKNVGIQGIQQNLVRKPPFIAIY